MTINYQLNVEILTSNDVYVVTSRNGKTIKPWCGFAGKHNYWMVDEKMSTTFHCQIHHRVSELGLIWAERKCRSASCSYYFGLNLVEFTIIMERNGYGCNSSKCLQHGYFSQYSVSYSRKLTEKCIEKRLNFKKLKQRSRFQMR